MVTPFLPDADKLAAVRAALPAVSAGIYLNTAAAGPLSSECAAAMAELADREVRMGRGHPADADDARQRADEARAAAASVLRADPRSIALTHGAADGLALALFVARPATGGRVVTTSAGPISEQGAAGIGLRPDDEIVVVPVDDGAPDVDIVARFARSITPSSLVALPHVAPTTGAVLPVDRIAAAARERGATVVVDGSAAAGAVPVDPAALGADAYVVDGRAWLLGPDGIGALWLGPALLDRTGSRDASGVERGSPARIAVAGLARAIGWLAMFVGWEYVHRRGPQLARSMVDRLAAIPGVDVLTPRDRMATIVSFRIAGWSADRALDELADRTFLIADTIPAIDAIRLCVGFFSTTEELERVASGVELLAAHTPDDLPRRPRLAVLGTDLA